MIIQLKNLHGVEFPIRVELPLDAAAVRRSLQRPESGYLLCYSQVDVMDFMSSIAYLPETAEQLAKANELYRTGLDWHTACERAKGAA